MSHVHSLESRKLLSAGSVDLSYGGGDGIVNARTNSRSWAAGAVDVVVDDTGRLLIAAVYPAKQQITVTRLRTDGSVDTSFGDTGIATIASGFNKTARGPFQLAVDHVGKPLILFKNRLTRLNVSGGVDRRFGSGGIVINGFTKLADLAIDAKNRPLIIGTSAGKTGDRGTVARYGPRGVLDPSFASGGFFKTPVPKYQNTGLAGDATGTALKITPDGSILGVTFINADEEATNNTSTEHGISAFRLTSTGALDTTYGSHGYVRSVGYSSEWTSAGVGLEAIYDDGRMIIAHSEKDLTFGATADAKTWFQVDTDGDTRPALLEGLVDDLDRDDDETIFPPYYTKVTTASPDDKLIVRYDQKLIRYNADFSRDSAFSQVVLPISYRPAGSLSPVVSGDRLLSFSVSIVDEQQQRSVICVTAFEL